MDSRALKLTSEDVQLPPLASSSITDVETASVTTKADVQAPSAYREFVPTRTKNTSEAVVMKPPFSYTLKKNDWDEQLGYLDVRFDSFEDAISATASRGDGGDVGHTIVLGIHTYSDSDLLTDIDNARNVFSHPLIAEAIDTLFVAVHRKDVDDEITASTRNDYDGVVCRASSLTTRKCKSSIIINNKRSRPAACFLDDCGNCLVPMICVDRLNKAALVMAMIKALEVCHRPVPKYLTILRDEECGRHGEDYRSTGWERGVPLRPKEKQAVFGVADSALGEVQFAGLDGVLKTQVGHIEHQRAVAVDYDSNRVSYSCLVRHAFQRGLARVIYFRTNDERIAALIEVGRVQEGCQLVELSSGTVIHPDIDPKRDLRRTPFRFVPLTGLQSTRVNRLVHLGRFDEAMHILSPRQGLILMKAMQHVSAQKSFHEVVDVPILPAWISVCDARHPKRTVQIQEERQDDETQLEYSHYYP